MELALCHSPSKPPAKEAWLDVGEQGRGDLSPPHPTQKNMGKVVSFNKSPRSFNESLSHQHTARLGSFLEGRGAPHNLKGAIPQSLTESQKSVPGHGLRAWVSQKDSFT